MYIKLNMSRAKIQTWDYLAPPVPADSDDSGLEEDMAPGTEDLDQDYDYGYDFYHGDRPAPRPRPQLTDRM